MTIERAKRLAEQWSEGHVCTLREGEAAEYHKMFARLLSEKEKQIEPITIEELHGMAEEPIWILFDGSKHPVEASHWYLLSGIFGSFAHVHGYVDVWHLAKVQYGVSWLAYREALGEELLVKELRRFQNIE